MQYHLRLTEQDYLNNFLFLASSKKIRKRRKVMAAIFTGCFLVVAASCFITGDTAGAGVFIVLAILVLSFYGTYSKWVFKRQYVSYVKNNYQFLIDQPGTVELTDKDLITTNEAGESKVKLTALKDITETDVYYFFRTVLNSTLNIPKGQLPDGEFDKQLKEVAAQYQIPIIQDSNWRF